MKKIKLIIYRSMDRNKKVWFKNNKIDRENNLIRVVFE